MSKMLNEVKNSQPITEKVETNAENDVIQDNNSRQIVETSSL